MLNLHVWKKLSYSFCDVNILRHQKYFSWYRSAVYYCATCRELATTQSFLRITVAHRLRIRAVSIVCIAVRTTFLALEEIATTVDFSPGSIRRMLRNSKISPTQIHKTYKNGSGAKNNRFRRFWNATLFYFYGELCNNWNIMHCFSQLRLCQN